MRVLVLALCLAGILASSRAQFNPCSPAIYNELNEPHRSTGYLTGYPEQPICDIHMPEGWYRFTSRAGGEMPTTCPDRLKCGTVVPIWMRGTHPSVADDIVMREACGNFNTGSGAKNPCCEHKVDIAVKNCTGFYVYYLSPTPSCPVAYCAGDIPPCPLGKWSPTGFAPCKDAHPQLKTPPTLSGPHIINNKSFEFHCDVNWPPRDPDQRFDVIWTFDGKEDPAIPPYVLQDPDRRATLDGTLLRGHMNTNVRCEVLTYYDGNQAQKSGVLKSNSFYAGISMNPPKLVVSEKQFEEEITISSTIPVICDHNTECCITFKLNTDATTDISVQSMCDYKLCDTDWDPKTRSANIEVPIVANQDMIKDGDKQLLLTFEDLIPAGGGPYHRVFEGHTPDQIQVDVKDQDTSRCSMTGDPHIHGFDYQTYHLYKTGDFVAYEVKSRDFQVMIRTWACGAVACICGVTIRERNDVIKINECDQAIHGRHTAPTIEVANKLSEGTIIQRSRNGRHIGVYLSSGTEVKLDVNNWYMNMFITAPGTDKNRAFGLCGTNDGNPANEFTRPDGTEDPVCAPGARACIPDSFEEGWRSASKDSLFEQVPPLLPDIPEIKYCACKDNHHGSPAINCTIRTDKPTSRTACNGCPTVTNMFRPNFLAGKSWTKRDVVFDDVDIPDAPYVQKDIPAPDPNRAWPNDQGITEGHALALCTQAISKSQLVSKCRTMDSSIEKSFLADCLSDILHGGTTDFLNAITDAFTSDCQQTIAKEPSSYVSDPVTGERILKPEYLDEICQTDCLENGHCGPRGKCVCNAGWEGEFCHMVVGKGPQLDKIRSGPLCDKSQRPCKRVFIDATNMDLSDDLSCKVQEVDDQGKAVGKAVITDAEPVSATRIACEIPETTVSSKRYQVSATNDGSLYGNALDLLVFDSICLDCTGAGCTEKLTACHIGEVCYSNGQVDKTDSSRECVVAQNRTEWTIVVTTPRPQLEFFPTLSGPNVDFLMTCRFFPKGDVTDVATVRWLVDGKEVKSESLTTGTTETFLPTAQLPNSGKLTCEVGMGGAASMSGSVNLAFIQKG